MTAVRDPGRPRFSAERMVQFMCTVRPDQRAWIESLAVSEGLSVAEVVRRLIDGAMKP